MSHDLRTPLASIKACVTSLLADDVEWPVEAITEFCRTIDEETDRLTGLVANLLDMSRLQAGAVSLHRRASSPRKILFQTRKCVGAPGVGTTRFLTTCKK